jgi:moderate conductance mechanosensitive channel
MNNIFFWLQNHGIKILIIIFIAYLLKLLGTFLINKFVQSINNSKQFTNKKAEKKRINTLIEIFTDCLNVLIILSALFYILQEFNIQLAPLMATAGIAGVALGFGAQYLVRDIISGLFIIMENQYRVGDVVCLNDICGEVEDITLRMTTLRDLDGTVHYVPHGEIKKVSNLSKNFSGINLNLGISYNSNIEKVIKVVNKIGEDMKKDPVLSPHIIEAPKFLRINDFADSAIIIKIIGKTKPLKQWEISGELRKRIKIAFDKENIEIPFPQTVIHQSK